MGDVFRVGDLVVVEGVVCKISPGIENMPTVSVQSNLDGSFKNYDT